MSPKRVKKVQASTPRSSIKETHRPSQSLNKPLEASNAYKTFPSIGRSSHNNTSSSTALTATTTVQTISCGNGYLKSSLRPSFLAKRAHLRQCLRPLVSVTTGLPHPSFPTTVLAYHLLTSSELDALAAHYHQFTPSVPETNEYPTRIPAWVNTRG
ncbi:hypothetical protein VTO42DRAFT_5238 [Malbranchea cinnamomea]